MRNIYEKAVLLMNPNDIDFHETDLYLKVNKTSQALVNEYDFKNNVTRFTSNIPPHVQWYDIPFAYLPGWDPKNRWPNNEQLQSKKTEG